jgi:hypothetical protein
MAKFGAGNPHCQSVADAERLAAGYVPTVSEQTIYVASAWWHDCDTFVTVCGNSPKRVEKAITRAMRDAATDVYNESEPEDKRKVRDRTAAGSSRPYFASRSKIRNLGVE